MEIINVRKCNENEMFVDADQGTHYEISDHFKFLVPGYKYMPAYKSGRWDGFIRLYNINMKLLPQGLLPDLAKFCRSRQYKLVVDKTDMTLSSFRDTLPSFIKNIHNYTTNSPTGKYQYQSDILKQIIPLNKSLVLSPTGSGKSNIIYLLTRFLLDNQEGDILILVPTVTLVEQMTSDFASYVADDFDVDANVSKKYSGKEIDHNKRVLISTWQSIYKKNKSFFSRFNVFVCDEVHGADNSSISKIINNLSHCRYKYGFTGTLDGTKIHELSLRAYFGPLVKKTSTQDLMKSDVLSNLKIDVQVLKYPKHEIKQFYEYFKSKPKYEEEIDWIIGNTTRNAYIADTALNLKNNTLILFSRVDKHGKILTQDIASRITRNKLDMKVHFISGEVPVDTREKIRHECEESDNNIILATSQIFSTGVNIKNLHNIIFAHPFKARIRNLQSIGRVLRLNNNKKGAILIDVVDDLRYKSKKNFCYEHFVERLKIYTSESFAYSIKEVSLEGL